MLEPVQLPASCKVRLAAVGDQAVLLQTLLLNGQLPAMQYLCRMSLLLPVLHTVHSTLRHSTRVACRAATYYVDVATVT